VIQKESLKKFKKILFIPKSDDIKVLSKMQIFNEPHKINGEDFLRCLKCDFISESENFLITNEKIKEKELRSSEIKDDKNVFATYLNKCKKCGHDKAQVLDMGIFYSDEDNLILLRCGNCGFSERIGRKTS
jgi:DNA-directed RNA polymerase subunit M/transcription elongation factor TFIIS